MILNHGPNVDINLRAITCGLASWMAGCLLHHVRRLPVRLEGPRAIPEGPPYGLPDERQFHELDRLEFFDHRNQTRRLSVRRCILVQAEQRLQNHH